MEKMKKYRFLSIGFALISLGATVISVLETLTVWLPLTEASTPVFADFRPLFLSVLVDRLIYLLLPITFIIHCAVAYEKKERSVSFAVFAFVAVTYNLFDLFTGFYLYGAVCAAFYLFVAIDGLRGFKLVKISIAAQAVILIIGLVTTASAVAVIFSTATAPYFFDSFVNCLPSLSAPAMSAALLTYLIYAAQGKKAMAERKSASASAAEPT